MGSRKSHNQIGLVKEQPHCHLLGSGPAMLWSCLYYRPHLRVPAVSFKMIIVGFSFIDNCDLECLSLKDLLFLEPKVITGLGEQLVPVSSALEGDLMSQIDTS